MKIFTGIVKKTGDKTAKVAVERVIVHPIYGKRLRRTKNYLVHDEAGVKVGERVQFVAVKPISKKKRWAIINEKKIKSKKK